MQKKCASEDIEVSYRGQVVNNLVFKVLKPVMLGNARTFTWRGTYAEENAFALCPAMRWPQWLHMVRSGLA